MDHDFRHVRKLRRMEGWGCVSIIICALMLITAPLIVLSACASGTCGGSGLKFLAIHMGGTLVFLALVLLVRKYVKAALKRAGQ